MGILRGTFILLLFIFTLNAFGASEVFTLKPEKIFINFTYHGAKIKIIGEGNCVGKDYIVNIFSTELEKATFKKIEKVAGLIWMKTGEVHFEGIPLFYHIYSTKPLKDLLPEEELEKYKLTFETLGKEAKVSLTKEETQQNSLWQEFVKYKMKHALFRDGIISPSCTKRDQKEIMELSLFWPYQAPPGIYKVRIFEIANGKILSIDEKEIEVMKAGFVKFLTNFSREHAFIYGVVSVLIALISGFLVGMIFKKGGH